MKTTVEVFTSDHKTLRQWAKAKNMKMAEFMSAWIQSVVNKKQQSFYNLLPMPNKFVKPLENTKIRKNYRKISCI